MEKMLKHNYPFEPTAPLYRDVRDLFLRCTETFSDRIAFTFKKKGSDKNVITKTFAEFRRDVIGLGTKMMSEDLHKSHVALIGKNSYEWICCYFALLSIGSILVPLDRDWTADELSETLKRADCTRVFCDGDMKEKGATVAASIGDEQPVTFGGNFGVSFDEYLAEGIAMVDAGDHRFDGVEIDPLALSLMVFTSGTTGKGKGVMHNQRALATNVYGAFCVLHCDERTIGLLPPHHTFGSTITILASVVGGTNMYITSGIRYVVNELKLHKPKYLLLVPLYLETFHRRIWAAARDGGKEKLLRTMMKISNGLRRIGIDLRKAFFKKSVLAAFGGELQFAVSGGAPVSQEIIDDFDAFGVKIINGYGITECAPLISANRMRFITPGSVGVPIPNEEVKIVNPTETGEGEICVKGPNVMLGYYGDPKATAEAIDEDGFFHTGDIGKIDKNGAIFITGRSKNIIILSNGKNVYPEEIEAEFAGIDGVVDLVIYEGQSRRGVEHNAIVLEVFPDADWMKANDVSDFEAYIKPRVEQYNRTAVPYKKIGMIRIRETEFPKNTLRKITRFKLDRTID